MAEFICEVAETLKEAAELIEAGFKCVTEMDGCKQSRKYEALFAGSSTSLVEAARLELHDRPERLREITLISGQEYFTSSHRGDAPPDLSKERQS